MTFRMYAMYILSFAMGLVLNLMDLGWVSCDWVALILLYWALHGVHYYLLPGAIVLGFMMDVLTNEYFGVHASVYCFLLFFGQGAALRMRVTSLWEKAFFVTLLVFLSGLFQSLLAYGLYGVFQLHRILMPLMAGLVLWSVLHLLLHAVVGADIEDQIQKDLARL